DGIRMHAAPTQAGGASLEWAAALLGRAPAELPALAATAGTGPIPFFLPHLAGERAPIWDAASRGSFARRGGGTGPAPLARAALEGVALPVRWAVEALEAPGGRPIEPVRISGGGSPPDIWCQIRADILGMRLERAEVPAAAALGAAILAGVGSGAFPSLAPAIRQLVRHDREFLPDAGKRAQCDEAFAPSQAVY